MNTTDVSRGSAVAEHRATIELVGVTKRYEDTVALRDVSLEAGTGELVVLLGPSGCGKSTALKIIAGLEDASEGEVYIDGQLVNYVEPTKRNVAMVFQNYALYPHMTTERNIGFPLKMSGMDKRDVAERVSDAVELLELEPELHKYPGQLSGGQRQRVALGRAIVRDPVAFLMDEPLSNLDALLRVQMREELMKLHDELGRTMLYVTHDQMEAMTMADRIVVLRSGLVQQIGTPWQIYSQPANTFVAGFVGSPQMSMFDGELRRDDGLTVFESELTVLLGGRSWGSVDRGPVTLGVRAEDVQLVDGNAEGAIPGVVTHVEPTGADTYLRVEVPGGGTCAVRVGGGTPLSMDDRIHLRFPPEKVHLFGGDQERIEADPAIEGAVNR